MLKSLILAGSVLAIALAAQDAGAASQSCTSTRCTVNIGDSSPGWVHFGIYPTYVSVVVYYNGGNNARTCYSYAGDPNFDRISAVFAAAAAAPAASSTATFVVDYASSSSSSCSSASIAFWR